MNENKADNTTPTGVQISYTERWNELESIYICQSQNCNNMTAKQHLINAFNYYGDYRMPEYRYTTITMVHKPMLPSARTTSLINTLITSKYESGTSIFPNTAIISSTSASYISTTITNNTMTSTDSTTTKEVNNIAYVHQYQSSSICIFLCLIFCNIFI